MRVLFTSLFILLNLSIARSEYINPSDIKIKTENYVPEKVNFKDGTYKYKISWQGIPVATANIDVKNDNDTYKVNAKAKTKKWLSVFYKLKFDGDSEFDSKKLEPRKFNYRQIEKSKKKVKNIEFNPDGTIYTKSYKNGREQQAIKFNSGNQTLDPITAAFLARSLPISEGAEKSFDVFTGKHRYLIIFNVGRKEKIRVNNKDYLCYKVTPKIKKLTDTEGEKKFNSASIWITADEKREIVKLESSVFVGSIKAELEQHSLSHASHKNPLESYSS